MPFTISGGVGVPPIWTDQDLTVSSLEMGVFAEVTPLFASFPRKLGHSPVTGSLGSTGVTVLPAGARLTSMRSEPPLSCTCVSEPVLVT